MELFSCPWYNPCDDSFPAVRPDLREPVLHASPGGDERGRVRCADAGRRRDGSDHGEYVDCLGCTRRGQRRLRTLRPAPPRGRELRDRRLDVHDIRRACGCPLDPAPRLSPPCRMGDGASPSLPNRAARPPPSPCVVPSTICKQLHPCRSVPNRGRRWVPRQALGQGLATVA